MKLRGEKVARRQRSVDIAGGPEEGTDLLFDPAEMLVPEDFARMMPSAGDSKHLAQDLGIGLLFFPEKGIEMKDQIEKIRACLESRELEQEVSRKRESFLFAVALLKHYLPEEQLRTWTMRAWADFKRTKRYNHQIVDTIKAALAVRMICPEKTEEVTTYLEPLKEEAHLRAQFSLDQLASGGLNTLSMVVLAFPSLRGSYPVPETFFTKMKDRFERVKIYKEPLLVEDVDYFPKTALDLSILANPETRIDEAGNLVFPRSRPIQKQSPLPPRNEL